MDLAALAIIAVIVLAFLAALAAMAFAGFRLFMNQQASFFDKLTELQAAHQADRKEDQLAYERFMEAQEAREQIVEKADEEWLKSPESAVAMDHDLDWGTPDG